MQISAEKFLQLEEELKPYRKPLGKAIDIMIQKEVSSFPIFIAHQDTFEAGVPIINRYEVSGNWSINASTLEEFVLRKIIAEKKVEDFKKTFKAPQDYICLFVLSELGAQFVFLPR